MYYDIIDIREEIGLAKSNNIKKSIICYYQLFDHRFAFQDSICNVFRNLLILCLNISDIVIITVKGVDYCFVIRDINKFKPSHLLENSVLEDRGYIIKITINSRVHYHSV